MLLTKVTGPYKLPDAVLKKAIISAEETSPCAISRLKPISMSFPTVNSFKFRKSSRFVSF